MARSRRRAVRRRGRAFCFSLRSRRFRPLRTLHDNFVVAEGLGIENLALAVDAVLVAIDRAVAELAVCLDDQLAAKVGDVVPLRADTLASRFIATAGVDQLHLARAAGGLVLRAYPDISGNARVHELVVAELDDGVEPVVFEDVAANLAGAAARVAGEERAAVLDNRHLAIGRELREAVQHEKLLAVGDFR